ncbi:hypothetical protein CHS0354_038714 [Potamilus streckersoni]|uniref:Uncharacterized protein n=1 Tax=Potamilus streckersoni TaxID=2493646 RepID=A0AAE0VUQ8_9BIVA|nr:hypothetical protein CHS0354_038714 [Potamilus streckersoni]
MASQLMEIFREVISNEPNKKLIRQKSFSDGKKVMRHFGLELKPVLRRRAMQTHLKWNIVC